MAVFNINGQEADDMNSAFDIVRQIWSDNKASDVAAQRMEALSKPNDLDRQRAEAGVSPEVIAEAALRPRGTVTTNSEGKAS